MTAKAAKRHCSVPGCRAWARRGGMLCAAHSPKRQHSLQPLFALLERAPAADGTIDELQFIDDELRMLVDIRRVALNWLTEGPTDATGDAGTAASLSPIQFLRLWEALAGRMTQLLQARQRLRQRSDDSFGPLMDEVYEAIEEMLPREATGEAQGQADREAEGLATADDESDLAMAVCPERLEQSKGPVGHGLS